jgi:hypothetical protein
VYRLVCDLKCRRIPQKRSTYPRYVATPWQHHRSAKIFVPHMFSFRRRIFFTSGAGTKLSNMGDIALITTEAFSSAQTASTPNSDGRPLQVSAEAGGLKFVCADWRSRRTAPRQCRRHGGKRSTSSRIPFEAHRQRRRRLVAAGVNSRDDEARTGHQSHCRSLSRGWSRRHGDAARLVHLPRRRGDR